MADTTAPMHRRVPGTRVIDLTDQTFGHLTVVEFARLDKHRRALWRCLCECGKEIVTAAANLKKGDTVSCGNGCGLRDRRLVGKKFGRLTVVERSGSDRSGGIVWRCACECGGTSEVTTANLTSGQVGSCGYRCPLRREDLTGRLFGRWTVQSLARVDKNGAAIWRCICECGAERDVYGGNLRKGLSKSCGCLSAEVASERTRTHGQTGTRLYKIWTGMIARCTNPNDGSYANYGGRGIGVCQEWRESFEVFARDVAGGYADDLTIDRIDVGGNYEPGNVRWATAREQANNRRGSLKVEFYGQTKPLSEWCELLGLKYHTVYNRIRNGWDTTRALATRANPAALAALGHGAQEAPQGAVYVVRDEANGIVKPGVTSDCEERLGRHKGEGFATVARVHSGLDPWQAWEIERAILAAVAEAGIKPVRGYEYFPDGAMPIILRVLDHHPAIAKP